jgi:uncharacterized protein YukE
MCCGPRPRGGGRWGRSWRRRTAGVLGEHWRGESAEAFREYWEKVGGAVEETLPLFEQAAKGLEEAADNIEEINDDIHQIYLEIGVSIAASAALSFVTLGFSAAAGAANALRLAAQAADAASKLGRLLSAAARVFRYVRGLVRQKKGLRLAVELGVQWGAGTGTGIATSLATDNGPEYRSNAINGAVGVFGGRYLAGHLASKLGGGVMANAVDGATVGVLSSVAGDTINNLRSKQHFDGSQLALGAVAGGLTGGAGGAAVHRATDGRTVSTAHGLVGDVAPPSASPLARAATSPSDSTGSSTVIPMRRRKMKGLVRPLTHGKTRVRMARPCGSGPTRDATERLGEH